MQMVPGSISRDDWERLLQTPGEVLPGNADVDGTIVWQCCFLNWAISASLTDIGTPRWHDNHWNTLFPCSHSISLNGLSMWITLITDSWATRLLLWETQWDGSSVFVPNVHGKGVLFHQHAILFSESLPNSGYLIDYRCKQVWCRHWVCTLNQLPAGWWMEGRAWPGSDSPYDTHCIWPTALQRLSWASGQETAPLPSSLKGIKKELLLLCAKVNGFQCSPAFRYSLGPLFKKGYFGAFRLYSNRKKCSTLSFFQSTTKAEILYTYVM